MSSSIITPHRLRRTLLTAALVLSSCGLSFGLVNPGDVHFDSRGQLTVTGWLQMNEVDYGNGINYLNNTVTASGADWVEYENSFLTLRKEFTLTGDVLTITQYITPKNETGRTCKLETRLDFQAQSRTFTQWYQPWAGGIDPNMVGRILDARPGGSDWNVGSGCVGSYSCGVFIGSGGSLMIDRLLAGGYPTGGAAPSRVAADISEIDWPLYRRAPADFSPAQTDIDASWRDNRFSYDSSVNTLVYKLRFMDTSDPCEAIKLASQGYFGDRKTYGQTFYVGASAVSTPPAGPIASFSMAAASWGGGTSGINGAIAANCKQGLQYLRAILEDHNLPSYEMYFWEMLYEPDSRGGWGDLPTPEKPSPYSDPCVLADLRDLFVDMKASVPNLKVGLYVNTWAAWENSTVYTQHPTWFRSRSMTNDGGGTAYWGKLPEWGRHLYDPCFTPAEASIPEMIQSYGLDFVFFDNGGFADALSGDVTQMRTFFTNLVQAVHNAGAIAISNGFNPYMDMNYLERVAGQAPQQDNFFVDSYAQMYTQPRAVAPLCQRIGDDYTFAVPAFLNNGWTNDPGFVPYFPVHFAGGEIYQTVLDGYQQWAQILRTRHYAADFDADYYVNIKDFAVFARDWMKCSDPNNVLDCVNWP